MWIHPTAGVGQSTDPGTAPAQMQARNSVGARSVRARNRREKVPTLSNPAPRRSVLTAGDGAR